MLVEIDENSTHKDHEKIEYSTQDIDLLKSHISIGCLKCQLCNQESPKQFQPILVVTWTYIIILDDDEDWGTKGIFYNFRKYQTHTNNIYDSGSTILLPSDHPANKRDKVEIKHV